MISNLKWRYETREAYRSVSQVWKAYLLAKRRSSHQIIPILGLVLETQLNQALMDWVTISA